MSRRGLLLCAFPALSTVVLASSGETRIAPALANANENVRERGSPALFAWADVDGDARLDFAAVGADGTFQLLVNTGEGRFEDVTERYGLAGIENAALALWADYDGDTRLDLFVGAREGASRLYHNEGGSFLDMSAASGLVAEGAVQSAQWFDHDGDGRLDLFLVTEEGRTRLSRLFRGVEGGFFEPVELALGGFLVPGLGSVTGTGGRDGDPSGIASGPGRAGARDLAPGVSGVAASSGGVTISGGGVSVLMPPPPMSCMDAIKDQASLPACIQASTTPTLGRLFPISPSLFVATGGNVGIGTTSPAAKLDVAGPARAGTLTLSGDPALDVGTGNIYKGGVLFLHTKGGAGNTGLGREALANVVSGSFNSAAGNRALWSNTFGNWNTATGYKALYSNTTGHRNTASGNKALYSNTTGYFNTATGNKALYSNTTGLRNTAAGFYALRANTTGFANTADGYLTLSSNTTGFRNTASGYRALYSNTTGGGNTASGGRALHSNSTGTANTASGDFALFTNTTGSRNTACGGQTLFWNSAGNRNTANGYRALNGNTTGSRNTGSGDRALLFNETGNDNTACGYRALYNTFGSRNIGLGHGAGYSLDGSDNIAIGNPGTGGDGTILIGTAGTHTRAFLAGIRGVTTVNADAIPVLVDSAGQLGTVSSSRRFKKDIADMGALTERLLELRPVVFHYKQEQELPNGAEVPFEYGLIAEEVAEIFPDLVVHDEEGRPFTVKYHLLSAMLLNELKRLSTEHAREMEELRSRLDALEVRGAPVEVPASR